MYCIVIVGCKFDILYLAGQYLMSFENVDKKFIFCFCDCWSQIVYVLLTGFLKNVEFVDSINNSELDYLFYKYDYCYDV